MRRIYANQADHKSPLCLDYELAMCGALRRWCPFCERGCAPVVPIKTVPLCVNTLNNGLAIYSCRHVLLVWSRSGVSITFGHVRLNWIRFSLSKLCCRLCNLRIWTQEECSSYSSSSSVSLGVCFVLWNGLIMSAVAMLSQLIPALIRLICWPITFGASSLSLPFLGAHFLLNWKIRRMREFAQRVNECCALAECWTHIHTNLARTTHAKHTRTAAAERDLQLRSWPVQLFICTLSIWTE